MPDDFLDKDEALEHTAEAGEAAKSRVETLLEQFGETLTRVAENTARMADHIATLQFQKAAEDVPQAARETANDVIDTAGEGGDVAVKTVDIPLATAHDVIHDTAETAKIAHEDTKKVKKLFRKRR